ncbi:methylamine utilization protein [Stutzerimonas zhaodongensis]|uniref:methylamine utilization protein n=1 Tax=Stutzerimonas zhaodongensis TaxID=1176257 RepID=UPI003F6FC16D
MVMSVLRFSCFLMLFALSAPLQARPVSVQIFDSQGQPVAGAVLSLAGSPAGNAVGLAVMDQIDKQFSPAVLAVATGTAVSFPNHDDIRHQVYSFSSAKRFELRLYEGTPSAPVTFDQPGLVVLGCNIHDWMLGYVYVTDDPWFAVSDEQGRIQLNVPAGQYPSTLWHPALVDMRPISAGTLQMGAAPIELNLPVAVTAVLQPQAPEPTPFAEAFRKATRDAPQP